MKKFTIPLIAVLAACSQGGGGGGGSGSTPPPAPTSTVELSATCPPTVYYRGNGAVDFLEVTVDNKSAAGFLGAFTIHKDGVQVGTIFIGSVDAGQTATGRYGIWNTGFPTAADHVFRVAHSNGWSQTFTVRFPALVVGKNALRIQHDRPRGDTDLKG
jgi:hypothetical protein